MMLQGLVALNLISYVGIAVVLANRGGSSAVVWASLLWGVGNAVLWLGGRA